MFLWHWNNLWTICQVRSMIYDPARCNTAWSSPFSSSCRSILLCLVHSHWGLFLHNLKDWADEEDIDSDLAIPTLSRPENSINQFSKNHDYLKISSAHRLQCCSWRSCRLFNLLLAVLFRSALKLKAAEKPEELDVDAATWTQQMFSKKCSKALTRWNHAMTSKPKVTAFVRQELGNTVFKAVTRGSGGQMPSHFCYQWSCMCFCNRWDQQLQASEVEDVEDVGVGESRPEHLT